jgi:hypothetical protein
MPPKDAFPAQLDEEEKTDKSLGHTVRYLFSLLKDPKNLALVALLVGLVYDKGGSAFGPKDEYWGKDEIRAIIKQEVSPLQEGFKAYVKTLPPKHQLLVLQAMSDEQAKLKRAN